MGSSHEKTLWIAMYEFSDYFGVTPPQTKDVGEWWHNAVYELDKEAINFLYETFTDGQDPVLQFMKTTLEHRKKELDIEV